jgi:hypothetical protein
MVEIGRNVHVSLALMDEIDQNVHRVNTADGGGGVEVMPGEWLH